jgi:hemoglobin-like flavoprotein
VSPESERLVRETWQLIAPASEKVVAAFYARLFEANPAAAELFASTNMIEQRRKFSVMLNEIVRVLDNPNLLVGEVAASGKRHVSYGVKERDYDDVGAALTWAIGQSLGERNTPEVQAAWREAYALLAAVMKRAATKV